MEKFDVIVIGGGPAGLMAAIRAAQCGESVLLAEKNKSLGVKLLMAGRGRCNFTNAEEDMETFISKYGANGRFLWSAFSSFGPAETLKFFHDNGIDTVTERGKRVFPLSAPDNAGLPGGQRVLNTLIGLCRKHGVRILREAEIRALNIKKGRVERLITGIEELSANRFIIATGGKSYPRTGSTGDGYRFAEQAGHTVVAPVPALVPIRTKEQWVKLAGGCDMRNVRVTAIVGGREIESSFGEMEFTNFGLSGPIIMEMSSRMPDMAAKGSEPALLSPSKPAVPDVVLSIDLKPALEHNVLRDRIRRDFEAEPDRRFGSALRRLVPGRIVPMILELSDVPDDKIVQYISEEEIEELARLLKDIRLTYNGPWNFSHAVVTRGGVSLKEIEPATMRSKLCENLYFAGEVLDLNGPSGGFNLQVCWSTGWAAGGAKALQA